MSRIRWLALGLAMLGLVLMLLGSRRQAARPADALTLLTPGRSGKTAGLVLALPGSTSGGPQIPDVGYLARHYPGVRTLTILGDGLRRADLRRLPPSVRVIFSPPAQRFGWSAVAWPDAVQLGSPMIVEGRVAPPAGEVWQVELRSPGGTVASVSVDGRGDPLFRLSDLPPAAGRYVYQLVLRDARGEKVAGGDFGVEVRSPRPLRVLMLENAPRFETRALKSWLAGQGFAVAVRSRLGKDVFRKEELNGAILPDGALREEALRSFDLALADAATLVNLPPEELAALERVVRDDGLGLLVLADATLPEAAERKKLLPFTWAAVGEKSQESRIILPGRDAPLEGAVESFPARLNATALDRMLVLDADGRALAAARRVGEGRTALSLVLETQRWPQGGNSAAFAEYWSHLLGALVSAPKAGSAWTRVEKGPIFPHQPVAWRLITEERTPVATWEDVDAKVYPLALKQELFDRKTWTATCWPRASGWQTVRLAGGAEASFWVAPPEQWSELEAARRREETSEWMKAGAAIPAAPAMGQWLGVLGALLLLGGAGFLWIVERRAS